MVLIHGTCVDLDGAGLLIRGPSGSGKSDLAVRLIDAGARLVADDQVALEVRDGTLVASAPAKLRNLIEVRGLGVVPLDAVEETSIRWVVDLKPLDQIERMPEARICNLEGIEIPCMDIAPFEVSSVAKLRLALRQTGGILG
ncbi:MAG: HPr kinase/phosphatase C-terminal domain-containing protein [Proteobacteria bacterium]|nr:HPr kinase/phosphatase C-terminal domain-containing protein [Pseudomonadota bacterium]